jgi:hypothetical protein
MGERFLHGTREARKRVRIILYNTHRRMDLMQAKQSLPPTTPDAERGSTIYFNNYRQYMADPQIFEGWAAHCIHADEEIP